MKSANHIAHVVSASYWSKRWVSGQPFNLYQPFNLIEQFINARNALSTADTGSHHAIFLTAPA